MTLREFMIVAHKKPIVVRELKKIGPTTRMKIYTKLFKTTRFETLYTFSIRKDGSLILNTAYGPIIKDLKGCW
jgi:hypothetical protein